MVGVSVGAVIVSVGVSVGMAVVALGVPTGVVIVSVACWRACRWAYGLAR